ncbi:ubiquinone oxidoreductase 20 kd subunit [Fomitopsis betulina]|nr:ubiquinone oxidoreductase 20 kd subunit [Fomitopsis betulina]
MLTRRLPRVARPLARLTSSAAASNTPAPAHETPSKDAVVQQAPNYPATWSTNQRSRPQGRSGPRFEQTHMDLQPNPLSAMQMIAEEPIRIVHGRKAVCDGGGGPLGHPKIFINLDQPGPRPCGYVTHECISLIFKPHHTSSPFPPPRYCGIRFEQAPHHGHEH